ncbi:698_t:CDS:2, partial [Gigaspora margarita]
PYNCSKCKLSSTKVHKKFPNLYPNFIRILKAQKATDQLQKRIKKCEQQLVENLNPVNSIKTGLLYNIKGIESDPITSVKQRFSSSLDTES